MAKVTTPLQSWQASGTLGKSIVFSSWKGIPYVREWVKPADPKTDGQLSQRDRMRVAVRTAAEMGISHLAYDAWALAVCVYEMNMSGYNSLISTIMFLQQFESPEPILIDAEQTTPDHIRLFLYDLITLGPSPQPYDFFVLWGYAEDEQVERTFLHQVNDGFVDGLLVPPGTELIYFQLFDNATETARSGIVKFIFLPH